MSPVLTVVDLGSNSFYLVQARIVDGRVDLLQRIRENVRLVAGVDPAGRLQAETLDRALVCLHRLGAITRDMPARHIRAVATSAVRRLTDPTEFLQPARAALGQAIDTISGDEEARLVWQGAALELPPSDSRQLVIDIGGGSTECIIGRARDAEGIASVDIGCITTCRQFFDGGSIDAPRWHEAQQHLRQQFEAHHPGLRALGWQHAWGTSGSARAMADISHAMGLDDGHGISADALDVIQQRLLAVGHIDRLQLPGLQKGGRMVIAGTTAVLRTLFDSLGINHMRLCHSAMREGILWQLQRETQPI